VQWDPEYSLHDVTLDHRSIQVGLSRDIVARHVNDWTVEIRDLTSLAHEMSAHLRSGDIERVEALLPREDPYPLADALAKTVGAS
jgi:hypothetical protein